MRLTSLLATAVTLFGALAIALSAPSSAAAQSSSGVPAWLQAHIGPDDGQIAWPVLQRARALYLQKRAEGEVRNPCYLAMDATRPGDLGGGVLGRRFYVICEGSGVFRAISAGHGGGRDLNGVNKTVSGLLKLLYPGAEASVSEEDLEWAVRLALEVRRRVKEQQKRIGAAEFRNTHFSYTLGAEGVEKFVSTPELQAQGGIGDEPLECGQVWVLSPGGEDEHAGLFRLEVNEGPGGGVRVLNNPVPAPFRESIRCAEQNLYARAQQLVGDRDPRSHEFSVQLLAFDAAKTGAKTGVGALIALSSALLKKSVRAGLVVVGEVTLGGTIDQQLFSLSVKGNF